MNTPIKAKLASAAAEIERLRDAFKDEAKDHRDDNEKAYQEIERLRDKVKMYQDLCPEWVDVVDKATETHGEKRNLS